MSAGGTGNILGGLKRFGTVKGIECRRRNASFSTSKTCLHVVPPHGIFQLPKRACMSFYPMVFFNIQNVLACRSTPWHGILVRYSLTALSEAFQMSMTNKLTIKSEHLEKKVQTHTLTHTHTRARTHARTHAPYSCVDL
jgi:hypothetical protein